MKIRNNSPQINAKRSKVTLQPTLETQKRAEQLYKRKEGSSHPDNQHPADIFDLGGKKK